MHTNYGSEVTMPGLSDSLVERSQAEVIGPRGRIKNAGGIDPQQVRVIPTPALSLLTRHGPRPQTVRRGRLSSRWLLVSAGLAAAMPQPAVRWLP